MKKIIVALYLLVQFISCTPKINPETSLITHRQVLENSFTGILVADAQSEKVLIDINSKKYFTPASNTKILSLYASLSLLPDSLEGLRYMETDSSFVIWGTGDPTFLHPELGNRKIFNWLTSRSKPLYLSTSNFNQPTQGLGWSWDDYNDDYQTEVSALPMYGNLVDFKLVNGNPRVIPAVFGNTFYVDPDTTSNIVKRENYDNIFLVNSKVLANSVYSQHIPMKTSAALSQQLLIDTLAVKVQLSYLSMPDSAKVIFSSDKTAALKSMMKMSDNFLAEQLLLQSSIKLPGNTLSTQKVIEYLLQKDLARFPQKPRWVDGSGLSRYNKFSPADMVFILQKLRELMPDGELFDYMAINGQKGSLSSVGVGEEPFIFAKSGSMSGVYNLSGYLKAKSGKLLTFSIMNNNFTSSVSEIRKETEKMILEIRDKY